MPGKIDDIRYYSKEDCLEEMYVILNEERRYAENGFYDRQDYHDWLDNNVDYQKLKKRLSRWDPDNVRSISVLYDQYHSTARENAVIFCENK